MPHTTGDLQNAPETETVHEIGFRNKAPTAQFLSTHRLRVRPNSTLFTSALDLPIPISIYKYPRIPRPVLNVAIPLRETCASNRGGTNR
jgi:hypothetical protein